ncbi:MAG TPA: helix-turn-helix transcriptional regulator [Malonomonas sp.]
MTPKDIYAMSDKALAAEVGQRIDQLRLEQNITQEQLAAAVGVTEKTYRRLVDGGGKFETLIAVLRVLGQLELLDRFIPQSTFSPLQLSKLKGKERQRASGKRGAAAAVAEAKQELDW